MNPKVILFDLGDVVCRFVPERRLELLAAACGTSPQDVREALYGTGLVDLWDQGGATAGRIHETVRSELGFKGGRAELERLWCAAFDPDHEVLRLVRASRPCRTALFTNNDALLLSALPRVMPQVAECFDKLVFSCELGAKSLTRERSSRPFPRCPPTPQTPSSSTTRRRMCRRREGWASREYGSTAQMPLRRHGRPCFPCKRTSCLPVPMTYWHFDVRTHPESMPLRCRITGWRAPEGSPDTPFSS